MRQIKIIVFKKTNKKYIINDKDNITLYINIFAYYF